MTDTDNRYVLVEMADAWNMPPCGMGRSRVGHVLGTPCEDYARFVVTKPGVSAWEYPVCVAHVGNLLHVLLLT
jgi:hypothetical protein